VEAYIFNNFKLLTHNFIGILWAHDSAGICFRKGGNSCSPELCLSGLEVLFCDQALARHVQGPGFNPSACVCMYTHTCTHARAQTLEVCRHLGSTLLVSGVQYQQCLSGCV
jgi:hypothetical protein